MAFDDFDDDDYGQPVEEPQNNEGPRALREALEKAKKAVSQRDKELEQLKKELAQLQSRQRDRDLGDLLKAKKVDPKYAKWAAKDGVEPTEDAVAAWLEENKELVPVRSDEPEPKPQANEPAQPTQPQDGQPATPFTLPPEVQAALQAMSQTQAMEAEAHSGYPVDPTAEDAVERSLAAIGENAKSEADIVAALKALGAPVVNNG